MKPSLAVLILTFNEEMHIARAIRGVLPVAREIFVIDSHSTDRTAEIARSMGATVLFHRWRNYSSQFQWGMDNAPISADWILRLDADEIIESDLASRIEEELAQLPLDVSGVTFARKHIFMDRWVRHGGRYPLHLLRLFRRGCAGIEQRWMDEHIVLSSGRCVHFAGGFADHNLKSLDYFVEKHNLYATREALDVLNRRHCLFPLDERLKRAPLAQPASLKRWIKDEVYVRIPYSVSALCYFLWRYVWRLGFLDGHAGLVYHVLQGFWYRFLVGAKALEFERAIAGLDGASAKCAKLAELTGLDIEAGNRHSIGVEQGTRNSGALYADIRHRLDFKVTPARQGPDNPDMR